MENSNLQHVAEKFRFTQHEMLKFFKVFKSLDTKGSGFIELPHIYQHVGEALDGVAAPFIDNFFLMIDKEIPDKMNFIEWLPAVSSFCLFTKE